MKRLFGVLGVFALLGSLFVLASTSASADPPPPDARVKVGSDVELGGSNLVVTSYSANCKEGPGLTLAPEQIDVLYLPGECNDWFVTAVDADGRCTVGNEHDIDKHDIDIRPAGHDGDSGYSNSVGPIPAGTENAILFWLHEGLGLNPEAPGKGCVSDNNLRIDKDVDSFADADWAAAQGSFTFLVNSTDADGPETTSPCAASNASYTVDGEPTESSQEILISDIVNAYILNNLLVPCIFAVTELVPGGWTVVYIDFWETGAPFPCGIPEEIAGPGKGLPREDYSVLPTAIVAVQYAESQGPAECEVDFTNELDPIPLTVTKTFTGRDYYTTIDRADFHLYTPGLCGTFPSDPFGGLLGSVGVFRTINASQLPQIVIALPTIIAAGPNGPCTYRIQENNAPDGCVALDPDGSNADGPYWEQTWVFGETTEMNFNIVNDCAEPEPEPTVAPTTAPKKPAAGAKKPSSGGTAAPKFTG